MYKSRPRYEHPPGWGRPAAKSERMSADQAIDDFRAALRAHGILPPEYIQADGQLHRCDVDARNGKGDAAYVLHLDGIPAGGFQNWQSGNGWIKWCSKNAKELTPAERAKLREKFERVRAEREADEKLHHHESAVRARKIWGDASEAPADHPYLARKGVRSHGLKVYSDPPLVIREMSCDGALIVPLHDSTGQIRSLEFITSGGKKRFLAGGEKSGNYFSIGEPNGVLVVAEGFATGASVHEATGHAVAVAFDAGNLLPVAKALRAKFPAIKLVISTDNDLDKERNVGLEAAQKAARAVNGFVALPELNGAKCDFNDVAQELGAEAVKTAIDAARPVETEPNAQVRDGTQHRDGESSRIDRRITELAKLLGIRQSTLDRKVKALRPTRTDDSALTLEDPEPWVSEVDGAELLGRIRSEVERYLVLPPHASTAIALWVLHTWCLDASFITPYLHVRSPAKRCGKTTLMILIREFVRRPLLASSASAAVIFRSIERFRPTLLLDEADTWLRGNEQLRGVLNGGHSRKTAGVLRSVGDDHEPHMFSTYCPKALAGIGRLADTLEDRSIAIPLKRKGAQDRTERLREDRLDYLEIRRQCLRWTNDSLESLRSSDPQTPPTLNDRAADNWRALLAIADAAGGEWPQRARGAAVALSGATDDRGIGTQLLEDIRNYFAREGSPAVFSEDLVRYLTGLEGRPWAEWGNPPKPISKNQVAGLLKHFEIRSRDVRYGAKVAKGYLQEHFDDVFARYLPLGSRSATALQPHQFESQTESSHRYSDLDPTPYNATDGHERCGVAVELDPAVADPDGAKTYENRVCSAVADQDGAGPQEEVF